MWAVLLRLSMVVRGSPCKDVAIVTQLVTQLRPAEWCTDRPADGRGVGM